MDMMDNAEQCPVCQKGLINGECPLCGYGKQGSVPMQESNNGASDKKSSNPYADVAPYEQPDFGENYAADNSSERSEGLLTEGTNIKNEKTAAGYWWLILITTLLFGRAIIISAAIGAALLKFDEKGGRQAGTIILAITAAKLLLMAVSYQIM